MTSAPLDLQEDAAGAIRMGCTVIGAVVVPLWLVVAASALYLVPGLGGDWMLDPATGDVFFQYHPLPTLVVRGGLVGGVVLAMGTPLVSLGFLLFSTASAMGRRMRRLEEVELGDRVGRAELSGQLVVRKRSSTGRTADAIPITEASASGLRRLLARAIDLTLLALSVVGAAVFGAMLHQADLLAMAPLLLLVGLATTGGVAYRLFGWLLVAAGLPTPGGMIARTRSVALQVDRALTGVAALAGAGAGVLGADLMRTVLEAGLVPTSILLGGLSAACLYLVQWLAISERGQTLGKMLFDIRLAGTEQRLPSWLRGVLVRSMAFEMIDAAIAVAVAVPASLVLTRMVGDSELGPRFVLPSLRLALGIAIWCAAVGVLPAIRSLPLLFARPASLHDLVAGTRVVRTAVVDDAPDAVPLGYRILARTIDGLLVVLAAGLPLSAELVRLWVLDGSVGWMTAGVVAVSSLLALAVLASQWLQLVARGDTVGKRAVGIEVVPLQGERRAVNVLVVREWLAFGGLALALGPIGLGIDGLAALSEDHRALHDHLAGTRVRWRG